MKATELYEILEKDFIFPHLYDEFAEYIPDLHPYMTELFKERSMGLVCDFTETISKVYTAVFPSDQVMEGMFNDNPHNAVLFLHHPSVWDFRGDTMRRWYQPSVKWIKKCKEHKISIYAIHVPLDNFGEYSTSRTLTDALGIKIIEPFAEYRGSLSGIIGQTDCTTTHELSELFSKTVGHKTSLYQYGPAEIAGNKEGGKVAIVAGGGNDMDVLLEVKEKGIDTLITGISVKNDVSAESHAFAKENKINILGGTHYSTEKFACQKMVEYFTKLGLKAQYLADVPVLEDL
jgi:putative NIF3 family GTP cyclohydrolase 1 type 2